MKKSDSEKYFTQKTFSTFEIVCMPIMALSVIAFLFIWGWGSIGLVTLLFSGGGFLFSRSLRVKDSDIDELIDAFAKDNKIELDSENLIKTFDLKSQYAAVGKDGKPRTGVFVTSEYIFDGDKTYITVHRFDLITKETKKETYELTVNDTVTLNEEYVHTPIGTKTAHYIVYDKFEADIPVYIYDMNSSEIVDKVSGAN